MGNNVVPNHLIDDIKTDNTILFVGAGVSAPDLPSGAEIAKELLDKAGYQGGTLPLNEAADYYCEHCDAGQRRRLIRFLVTRLLSSRYPTRAQQLIASIPYFTNIVTTNYDLLLDRCLNVTAIVESSDLVYIGAQERQLIKLHGCISRPHTIVITTEDYDKFLARQLHDPVCLHVRNIMTAKTVLFVGYSLGDSDFRAIYEQVKTSLESMQGQSYAVQSNPPSDKVQYWERRGISIIATTAEAFLSEIQQKLIELKLLVDPIILPLLIKEHARVQANYQRPESIESPYVVLISYQDGVLQALNELVDLTERGVAWSQIRDLYDRELSEFYEYADKGQLSEFVFTGGRAEALRWFLSGRTKRIPPYFGPKQGLPVSKMPSTSIDYDIDKPSPSLTSQWYKAWTESRPFI